MASYASPSSTPKRLQGERVTPPYCRSIDNGVQMQKYFLAVFLKTRSHRLIQLAFLRLSIVKQSQEKSSTSSAPCEQSLKNGDQKPKPPLSHTYPHPIKTYSRANNTPPAADRKAARLQQLYDCTVGGGWRLMLCILRDSEDIPGVDRKLPGGGPEQV